MVTHGLNLPRHGTETARQKCAGFTQSGVLAKVAGRSIKRTVQPRNSRLDGHSWESPIAGETRRSRDIRRSSIHLEKARACREAKGMCTCGGTRGMADGMR